MSEQKKMDAELRQVITEALVGMVSGVTGLVPPSGQGAIPDFVQAPIDRAVEKISASLPVGVPDDLRARCSEILEWQRTGVLAGNALRDYAAGKPYAVQHNALQVAEGDTAREAFAVIAAAPAVEAEQVRCDATELALLREYRLSGIAFNDAQGEGYTVEQSNRAEQRMEAAEKACWDFYAGRAPSLPAAGSPAEEVEVVAHVAIDDPTPEEHGDWDIEPDTAKLNELARRGGGHIPLMTVDQHNRIVAALPAQQSAPERVSVPVELLERACWPVVSGSDLHTHNEAVAELRALLNGGEANG